MSRLFKKPEKEKTNQIELKWTNATQMMKIAVQKISVHGKFNCITVDFDRT